MAAANNQANNNLSLVEVSPTERKHPAPASTIVMEANDNGSLINGCQMGQIMAAASTAQEAQSPTSQRVSFHDTRREVRVISLACLSEQLRNDIWYSQNEIDAMRTEARDLCRFLRGNASQALDDQTRGLELRISLERQCRKQLTVQGVVEAQRRCADPAFLACIAQRCSALPKELALAQAQRDYCTVYKPSFHDMIQLPAMGINLNMPPPEPIPSSSNVARGPMPAPLVVSAAANSNSIEKERLHPLPQQRRIGFQESISMFEPIPIVFPRPFDDPMAVDELDRNTKRASCDMLGEPEDNDRTVRRRTEGYPASFMS